MPKAGSTSIQLALHAAQESSLTPNGIWFNPPNGELSDYVLYDMLRAQDLGGIRAYAQAKITAAKRAGADTVIFSAERLFTIDSMQDRVMQLGRIFQEWADEVSLTVVVRDIRAFLRSYIIQMIYNGAVPLEDCLLAEWMIDQAQCVANCGFPVNFLSLDQHNPDQNIAEMLVGVSTGRHVSINLERMNVTPSRPIIYALAEGLAARFHALDGAADVNSRTVDQFRHEFMESFDRTMHGANDPEELNRILNQLNSTLQEKIDYYIEETINACNPAKLSYYTALLESRSTSLPNRNVDVGLAAAA